MGQILNTDFALEMVGGEKELLNELIKSFLEEKPFSREMLFSLVQENDTTEAAKYVHYFKGAAKQLGAELLGEEGQALENVLRKKTDGDIRTLTQNFIDAYDKTIPAMKKFYEEAV